MQRTVQPYVTEAVNPSNPVPSSLARQAKKAAKAEAAEAAKAERAAALAAEINSIDKVLDVRRRASPTAGGRAAAAAAVAAEAEEEAEEFLCKHKGVAHVHALWLTTEQIAADGRLSVQAWGGR